MTKYCTLPQYGTIDNKTTLELADDAANVGGANYIKTLQDMTAWIKEMQKTYPDLKLTLPFCTQEYMGNGQSYYLSLIHI